MKQAEPLFRCCYCLREGFTERGLKAHHCRVRGRGRLSVVAIRASMEGKDIGHASRVYRDSISMPKSTTPVLLSDRSLATSPVEQLQDTAVQQMQVIAQTERDTALRAILLGLTLHKVKACLPHGQFTKWLKSKVTQGNLWTPATAKKNASFYMRLAEIAVQKSKVTRPELLALPGDQTELSLDTAEGDGRRFVQKLTKFIGEKSLNELLREHGIKEAKKLGGARNSETDTDDEPEAPDAEALYFQSREEISGSLERIEGLILRENRLQHLIGHEDEIRGVVSGLRSLADKVEKAAAPLLKPAKGK